MKSMIRRIAPVFVVLLFFAIPTAGYAVSLGGYGADVIPDGNLTGGMASSTDVIDKTNTLSAGVVRRAEIYFPPAGNNTKTIRFKVWRQNGANFDLIGESGLITLGTTTTSGNGKNMYALATPITAQAGDYIGIGLGSNYSIVGMKTGSFTSKYKGSSDVTSGSVAESGFSSYAAALSIKYFDDDLLTSITPSSAYNDESKSVTIVGRGFQSGATVKLTKTGQADIVATNVVVGSSTSITADVDLNGKQYGLWNIVVTNPDTTVSNFANGFTVYTRGAMFLAIGDSIVSGSNRYIGPEAGGPSGNPLSQIWPYLSDATTGRTFYNAGIGSTTSANTNTRIQALLTSKTPDKVYVHIGTNDIALSVSLSSYLSNLSAIRTKVLNAGAEMIMDQMIPDNELSNLYIPTIKLWNGDLEKWAFDNNVKLAPTFQEMSSNTGTNDDELLYAYNGGDNAHPSIPGYQRMGQLISYAAVPTKKRVWGSTSFPLMSYESWRWFTLAGGAAISGDSDTGTLTLPQNATASSNVVSIQSGSKPVAIIPTVSAGSVSISYRTNSTNFARSNSGISWTTYTGPFTVASNQFIQVRLTGSSVSTASVTDAKMIWAPTTFTLTGPSSGSVNTASTNFTVTPDNNYTGTITITPSGGGLSTPIVLTFSDSATPQTFTITPTSAGVVTLTPTNNSTLTNPSPLTYTASAVAPGAPTSVTAVGGNAQATVLFSAPASDGGATITSYTATSSPGSFTATGSGSPLTVTGLTNGTPYTFTVTATNTAGTGSASSASNSVTPVAPDTTAPSVSLTAPSNGATVSGVSVTVSANASDNVAVAGVQFKLDGSNLQSEDTTSAYGITWDTTGTADGSHTLTAVARDTSSNTTTSSSVTVTVDNTAPVRSAGSPSTALTAGTTSTALSLTTDESATCKYSTSAAASFSAMTSFGTTGSTTHSTTISGLSNGTSYTYYVKCADGQGNTNASDYGISFSVSTPVNVAPTANAGIDQSITLPTSTATLSGTDSTDSDGTITTYAWSQTGGPTTATIATASAATTSISGLSQTGTYTFTLTVTDNSSATASDDVSITVASGGPRLSGSIGPRRTLVLPPSENVLVCKTDCLPSAPVPVVLPSTPHIVLPTKSLKWKATGPDVLKLQQFLNTHGFPVAPSGVGSLGKETQYFGLATRAAVIKFQKAKGLTPDGIVGPKTLALMR